MWTSAAELRCPADLAEALRIKRDQPEAMPLAGGSTLMPLLRRGERAPGLLLDLSGVDELRQLTIQEDGLRVGSLCTWSTLLSHPAVKERAPLLAEAARCAGGLATLNRGTLGGHVAAAQHDGVALPALLSMDAVVERVSERQGQRLIPLAQWLELPPRQRLERDELISALRLPNPPPNTVTHFRRVAGGWAPGAPRLLFAGRITLRGGQAWQPRLAFWALGLTPRRCTQLEEALEGGPLRPQLAEALSQELLVSEELSADAAYRKRVAVAVLRGWLEVLAV